MEMTKRSVTCIITGKTYTLGRDYFQKKVKEYKDEESLKKYFITKKAKTYINKGYTVEEIRNILGIDDTLPGSDTQEIKDIIDYHKADSISVRRATNTLNFATLKSDPQVTNLINNLKNKS